MNLRDCAAYGLGLLGLLHMGADLSGLDTIKAVLASTALAPAPRVLSAINGFESFSNSLIVTFGTKRGRVKVPLTRRQYDGVRGPYDRRNVYGAALGYGPVLIQSDRGKALFDAVANYAFCRDNGVLSELGLLSGKKTRWVSIEFESLNPKITTTGKIVVGCP